MIAAKTWPLSLSRDSVMGRLNGLNEHDDDSFAEIDGAIRYLDADPSFCTDAARRVERDAPASGDLRTRCRMS